MRYDVHSKRQHSILFSQPMHSILAGLPQRNRSFLTFSRRYHLKHAVDPYLSERNSSARSAASKAMHFARIEESCTPVLMPCTERTSIQERKRREVMELLSNCSLPEGPLADTPSSTPCGESGGLQGLGSAFSPRTVCVGPRQLLPAETLAITRMYSTRSAASGYAAFPVVFSYLSVQP